MPKCNVRVSRFFLPPNKSDRFSFFPLQLQPSSSSLHSPSTPATMNDINNNNNNGGIEFNLFSSFEDEHINNNNNWNLPLHDHHENNLTFSPSQHHFFFQPKPTNQQNNFDHNFNSETDFLPINDSQPEFHGMGGVAKLTTSAPNFATNQFGNGYGSPGFQVLRPLEENLVSAGEQPNVLPNQSALEKSSREANTSCGGSLGVLNDADDLSVDGSVMNYDSDDFSEFQFQFQQSGIKIGDGRRTSSAKNAVGGRQGGHRKGKKSGLPAKNLMAERRRREKLNDRLLLLRSVVPRISKMDRTSILADAIEYLKELLEKVNAISLELESIPSGSRAAATGFNAVTTTTTNLPLSIDEKGLAPMAVSPPGQPARIEVSQRDEGTVNIHMLCGRRPGLLLSIMRTLDGLGLDVQQAVISCFNGFVLDVYRAKRCNEEEDVQPDHIKAMLLESAGSHGVA